LGTNQPTSTTNLNFKDLVKLLSMSEKFCLGMGSYLNKVVHLEQVQGPYSCHLTYFPYNAIEYFI